LPEVSGVCKIPAKRRICASEHFSRFQEIHSGCCTVAAHDQKDAEASGGRFQSHAQANCDVLLEHYLVQMLLPYRV